MTDLRSVRRLRNSAGVSRNHGLQVRDLAVCTASGRELVRGISLYVAPGERVALIGESGSGKTLTAAAIMGLLPDNLRATGEITLEPFGNILNKSDAELSQIRGSDIAMVFQEPMTALDPLMRVGKQVGEAFELHAGRSSAIKEQTEAALAEVGLPPQVYAAYPHQLSGGQRQRVLLAMALANRPRFLIADEPTTALDATVQAQVLELLGGLVAARGTGLLFISHDLGVVARVAQRVYVMQDGRIVESGSVADVLTSPQHEYTKALVAASDLQMPSSGGEPIGGSSVALELESVTEDSFGALLDPAIPLRGLLRLRASADLPPTAQATDDGVVARGPQDDGCGLSRHLLSSCAEPTGVVAGSLKPVNQTSVTSKADPLISLVGVAKRFVRGGGLVGRKAEVQALRGVSFEVRPGERFGIVGESGSGKTTVLRIIAGLEQASSGSVVVLSNELGPETNTVSRTVPASSAAVDGKAVPSAVAQTEIKRRSTKNQTRTGKTQHSALTQVRSQVQMVFQDPKSSLDPRMKIGDIVAEPLLNPIVQHRIPQAATKSGRAELVAEMLASVGLPPEAMAQYPHEFSGGQRQRISIARALISQPTILLADEPVSALDVSVRAQVLQLLAEQVQQRNLTLVIVSHDLAVIQYLCDRIAIMRNGEIVEQGPTAKIWANPTHEYTKQLKAASL